MVETGTEVSVPRKISITFDDIKKYLCPKASDAEIGLFLKVCQTEGLNPFRREIYLVKYKDDQPASIIIATEAFLKSAESCPEFDGYEAGIILRDATGKLEFREGAFLLDEEEKRLVGGWARVKRKDRAKPFYIAVNIKECQKFTKEGRPTKFWNDMPGTMVRKVALSRALREAFPSRFIGIYASAEYEEIPEGELPPAYIKEGKLDWIKFWARQKEKGIDDDEVHQILGVKSIKEDWVDKGHTLEEAEEVINKALEAKLLEKGKKATSSGEGQGLEPPSDDRLEVWGYIQTLLKTLKAKPPDPSIIGWFNTHFKIEVSMEDFKQEMPAEKFTAKMLESFHNSLLAFESKRR